jgi:hypothetical protein
MEIGIKTKESKPILIDDLLGSSFIDLHAGSYGIFIPAKQIIMRTKFEWFARLSHPQVLQSNTIIGNYILMTMKQESQGESHNILEPLQNKNNTPKWVGFWKIPSGAPLYSIKPNMLGDNLTRMDYPDN